MTAPKHAWVCLACDISRVSAARFPRCPKCKVRMTAGEKPAPPIDEEEGRPCECLCHRDYIQTACNHAGCEIWETPETKARLAAMMAGFARIKALTKQYPAALWDEEYRKLANEIHTVGRECFWV
jgi:hypothetical protein